MQIVLVSIWTRVVVSIFSDVIPYSMITCGVKVDPKQKMIFT